MESPDRREGTVVATRGWTRFVWNVLFGVLRFGARHAKNAYTTFGILLLGGTLFADALTYAFAKFADRVMNRGTPPSRSIRITFSAVINAALAASPIAAGW